MCMRTFLNIARAVLLLVMGASGFYSWLLWDAMSEANITLGWLVTAFERSIAVCSICTICYCATFVIRKRRSEIGAPQQTAR